MQRSEERRQWAATVGWTSTAVTMRFSDMLTGMSSGVTAASLVPAALRIDTMRRGDGRADGSLDLANARGDGIAEASLDPTLDSPAEPVISPCSRLVAAFTNLVAVTS